MSSRNVLARLIERELANTQAMAESASKRDIEFVVIAARGTSDNAARFAQYLFGAINGLVVALATPSLFSIYKQPPRMERALVLGISQSGKSPDIVAVLEEARRQGALTGAITNDPASTLADQADYVIDLGAGPECSVAATKTYTSALAAICLLSASLQNEPKSGLMLKALREMPQAVSDTLSMNRQVSEIVARYRYIHNCVVIGRGFNYATAYELALKLKELTYTLVEPYSSADFLHGPLAVIEHGFPAIVLAPSGAMLHELVGFLQTLRRRQAELLVISDETAALELAHIPLRLPVTVPEWLTPITAILPGQLFAMHLAHIRRIRPGSPPWDTQSDGDYLNLGIC